MSEKHTPMMPLLKLAEEYAGCRATWHLENLYGTSKSYTAQKWDECDQAYKELEAALRTQHALLEQAKAALEDMNNGWKYIRRTHGDLYGVGWDRAQEKADSALAALNQHLEPK